MILRIGENPVILVQHRNESVLFDVRKDQRFRIAESI